MAETINKISKSQEMMKTKLFSFIGFVLLLCTCACNSKQVFEDTVEFADNTWLKDSIVRFSVDVTDTTQVYDIAFSIVNNDEYPYSNLYLFTDIVFPSNEYMSDTIEFILATPDGEWLGRGWSGYANEFQYKSNVRFPQTGRYTFSFEQAMRCTNANCGLGGLQSVSLSMLRK